MKTTKTGVQGTLQDSLGSLYDWTIARRNAGPEEGPASYSELIVLPNVRPAY